MPKITTKQYSEKMGVSCVAITRAMNKGKSLINIISYSKQGRDWVLKERNKVAKIIKGKIVVTQK